MSALQIRRMTPADVPAVAGMMAAGGWVERGGYMAWVLANPSIQALVGEADGAIVASGIATVNGDTGWVGSIFVDATARSRGYGRAITEAVCSLLDAAGCRTQVLMASQYGQPLYESMGFRTDVVYQVLMRRPSPTPPVPPAGRTLRPLAATDLPAILELDRRGTGEDRSALIRPLLEGGWGIEGEGRLRGFLVTLEPNEGTVVAFDPEDGACLLDQLRHLAYGRTDGVRTALPETNGPGLRKLTEVGWKRAFRTPRMLRGPSVEWEPELIWGVLSFGFG